MAWNLVSAAMGQVQNFGLNRKDHPGSSDPSLGMAHESLFWTIYRLERGLSLRLGRASNIRDQEISIEPTSYNLRSSMIGQLQGQIYDQLYSPSALSSTDDERRAIVAGAIAKVLKKDIAQMEVELNVRFCKRTVSCLCLLLIPSLANGASFHRRSGALSQCHPTPMRSHMPVCNVNACTSSHTFSARTFFHCSR